MEYTGPTAEATLPTGKTVVVREISGKAENILADESLIKQGKMITKLLQNLIISLDGEKPSEKEITALYSSDRRAILLEARILTYGNELVFDNTCINSRCRQTTEYSVDLLNRDDVTWTQMPEDVEIQIKLPASGKLAKIGPLTGESEMTIARQGTDDKLTDAALIYLRELEGVSPGLWRNWLNEASARDTQAIRAAMKSVDFGPNTNVEVECPNCGTQQNVELTGEYRFFFPTS